MFHIAVHLLQNPVLKRCQIHSLARFDPVICIVVDPVFDRNRRDDQHMSAVKKKSAGKPVMHEYQNIIRQSETIRKRDTRHIILNWLIVLEIQDHLG